MSNFQNQGQQYPPNYQTPPPNGGYSNQYQDPNQYYGQQQYPPQPPYPPQQQYSQPYGSYQPPPPPQSSYINTHQKNEAYAQYPPNPVPEDPRLNSEHSHGKVIKESRFRDWWAALLFLAFFILFIYLAIIFIPTVPSNSPSTNTLTNIFSNKSFIVMIVAMVIAIALSLLYMLLIHKFTNIIIKVSFWVSVLLAVFLGIYYISVKSYISGGLMLLFGILYGLSWFGIRHAIPFTEAVLKTVLRVIRKFPSTIITSLVFAVLVIAMNIVWYLTLMGSQYYMKRYQTCTTKTNSAGQRYQSCSNASLTLTYIYLVFIYFWAIQVIINVLHTTICGLFATYYFYEATPGGYPSKNPLLSSLKRASIYSFGSICFGSLLVAILQTLRALLNMARQSDDNNIITTILIVCADCILGCIQGLLEYFNKYAYIEIAIYGKPFMKAAKDTWDLLKSKGIMALVNDCLTGNVLLMGSLCVGLICGFVSYFISGSVVTAAQSNSPNGILLGFVGFVFGFSVFNTINGLMESGSSTTFVCLAEDPRAVARSSPELYSVVAAKYPDVISGIER